MGSWRALGGGELRGWFTRGVGELRCGWTLMRPGWRCVSPAGSGLASCARGRGWHGLSCGTERSTICARLPFQPSYDRVWAPPFSYVGDLGVFPPADFLLVDDPFRNKGVFLEASDSGSGMTCGVVRHLHGGEFRFILLLVV
jgi:hypothetical protein